MIEAKFLMSNTTPDWVRHCFDSPADGVQLFLQELCAISGAEYAHIRVRSRFGRFYIMVDSIGPYKLIGWHRRFNLLDHKEQQNLAYEYVDYNKTHDCQLLEQKFLGNSSFHHYLHSLLFGLWIPLVCGDIDFGYATVSWTQGQPQKQIATLVKEFMGSADRYLPFLFSACRSVITDNYIARWWKASGVILSAPSEALCYECIASACVELWGPESTTCIGRLDRTNNSIEIVTTKGHRAEEGRQNNTKPTIPLASDLFDYTLRSERPVISFSMANDERFDCHQVRGSSECLGSVIAAKVGGAPAQEPMAVISIEHKMENYFDSDDLRYLTGIAHIGYEALRAHQKGSERVAREIDTLFTQMSHDVAEPLTALVADADVLRGQASLLTTLPGSEDLSERLNGISRRAANIVETSLQLNQQVRRHLDTGIDGAATRVIEGRVNLYRLLNSLVDLWEEKATSQNVEIRPLFDSLRGIYVQCDEMELRSALGHLLGNAIKYSFWGRRQPQGASAKFGRHVNIVGRIKMGQASIEFQNYGVGILKSELSLVRGKFYRGELAIKEGRAGTGRGLWSASVFFEGLKGGIDINSEYKGSDPLSEDGPYFTTVRAFMPYISPEEV